MKMKALACSSALVWALFACQPKAENAEANTEENATPEPISQPLVSEIYTADPSAHVFNGRIYIYPSHDIESGVPDDDLGSQYDMKDYRVLSMDEPGGKVTVHDVALDIKDVPWAGRQMWAPDAAEKDGKYFLYFPAKDKEDIFRIGVAVSDKPEGPFKADPKPIPGSFSMDPSVFKDTDGNYYMYFGGIWGGQLQYWSTGKLVKTEDQPADDQPALLPKIAKMSSDLRTFAEAPKDVVILDESGKVILSGDHDKRFFEAAWVHKYDGKYYFSYSTGDTHKIAYATSENPYGPFTYQGVILNPVQGWTNHHSIAEFNGKWYLFYHDTQISGRNHLRNVKMTELKHNADGSIETITAYK